MWSLPDYDITMVNLLKLSPPYRSILVVSQHEFGLLVAPRLPLYYPYQVVATLAYQFYLLLSNSLRSNVCG